MTADVRQQDDVAAWATGAADNSNQRSDHFPGTMDACAGLIRLVSMLALEGRDEELGRLAGSGSTFAEPDNSSRTLPAQIRGGVANCQGIGVGTIIAILKANGAAPSRRIVEEAMASIKSSGEHDRIIASVAEVTKEGLCWRRYCIFCTEQTSAPASCGRCCFQSETALRR